MFHSKLDFFFKIIYFLVKFCSRGTLRIHLRYVENFRIC